MTNAELLTKIRQRIPEFYAEQNDGSWIWGFRCAEQEESSDTLIECLIDFAATAIVYGDDVMGVFETEEDEVEND